MNRAMDGDMVAVELIEEGAEDGMDEEKMSKKDEEDASTGGATVVWGASQVGLEDVGSDAAGAQGRDGGSMGASVMAGGKGAAGGRKKVLGRVVGIIKRSSWRPLCGSILPEEGKVKGKYALFVPVEKKFPKVK